MSCSCCLLLVIGLALPGCGNYQAPISEQGVTQVVRSPEIVSGDAGDEQSRVESRNLPPSYSSGASEPHDPVSTATNRSVARVNTPSTSPASPSGISRRSIGSSSGASSGRPSLNPLSHTVRAGDTLFSIAFQYDLDFRSLATANGLYPPYTIFVGQEIVLAPNAAGAVTDTSANAAGQPASDNGATNARITLADSEGAVGQPVGSVSQQIGWLWPHRGQVLREFQGEVSKGIDISGSVGDPVLAAGAGDVVYSGRGVQGTGNLIIVRHSDRYLSAYAHNSAMLVPEGQHVEAGQQIAEVGVDSAGVAMLHFEIRRDGASVDPLQYLPDR